MPDFLLMQRGFKQYQRMYQVDGLAKQEIEFVSRRCAIIQQFFGLQRYVRSVAGVLEIAVGIKKIRINAH